jgi:malonyl-CoA O-methyltransferase
MTDDAFHLERDVVGRAFDRASGQYEAAAPLQASVRATLLERVDELASALTPAVVLDIGAGTGAATAALRKRFARARVIALDLAEGMLAEAGKHQRLFRRFDRVRADAAQLPFADHSVDIIYSSLMLQWFDDPALVFAEAARVLKPGGLLAFSTFGPDTLRELRAAWDEADPDGVHVNRFIDVLDLGSALQRTGFAEPVLDVDRHRQSCADVFELLRGLQAIGAHNVNAGRPRALTGRRRFETMVAAYERSRAPAGLPATWEVVYGVAWAGHAREDALRVQPETRIDAGSLLGRLRRGRKEPR